MNLLDLLIIAPAGYFAYKGLYNGLIKEIFSLAGLFIAIFITFRYMNDVAIILSPFFQGPDTATIAAGIITFVLILILVKALSYWLEKIIDIIKLSFINKLAGMAFGAVKAIVLISALLLLLTAIEIPSENNRNSSLLYDHIIFAAPMAFDAIASVYPKADNFVLTIENSLQENNPLRKLPIFDNRNNELSFGKRTIRSY